MMYLLCFISFFSLMFFSLMKFLFSMFFIMNDLMYFIEWEIVSFNSTSIVMTLLLDWMSLLFMSFIITHFKFKNGTR